MNSSKRKLCRHTLPAMTLLALLVWAGLGWWVVVEAEDSRTTRADACQALGGTMFQGTTICKAPTEAGVVFVNVGGDQ